MSDSHATESNRDIQLENFAAELTSAAYPFALRQGIRDSWIKVELGLWRALVGTVKKWAPERPPAGLTDEFEAWREGLLLDLTESALYFAAKHGIKGSLLQVELGLYRTFRLVIRRRLTKVRYA
jgi:hypothetical protein